MARLGGGWGGDPVEQGTGQGTAGSKWPGGKSPKSTCPDVAPARISAARASAAHWMFHDPPSTAPQSLNTPGQGGRDTRERRTRGRWARLSQWRKGGEGRSALGKHGRTWRLTPPRGPRLRKSGRGVGGKRGQHLEGWSRSTLAEAGARRAAPGAGRGGWPERACRIGTHRVRDRGSRSRIPQRWPTWGPRWPAWWLHRCAPCARAWQQRG